MRHSRVHFLTKVFYLVRVAVLGKPFQVYVLRVVRAQQRGHRRVVMVKLRSHRLAVNVGGNDFLDGFVTAAVPVYDVPGIIAPLQTIWDFASLWHLAVLLRA